MSTVDIYVLAATRDNTRQAYQSALRHFEVEWGGLLPASPDSVARYLAAHGNTLAVSTLRQRLAALAQWHREHGFADPTGAPVVRKVMRGIQALHPAVQKRAQPLEIVHLSRVDDWLEAALAAARTRSDTAAELRHLRDRALVLLGFWRGFRGDELSHLRAEHVRMVPGEGMACYLPRTKTDRHLKGQTFHMPQLSRLCPVAAYLAWVSAAGIDDGAVFRRIDRWGTVGAEGLHVDSMLPLLRRVLDAPGGGPPNAFSTHSLRRGFANWASENGWDLKALMEHVGWKSTESALRYINPGDPYGRERIERALAGQAGRTQADKQED